MTRHRNRLIDNSAVREQWLRPPSPQSWGGRTERMPRGLVPVLNHRLGAVFVVSLGILLSVQAATSARPMIRHGATLVVAAKDSVTLNTPLDGTHNSTQETGLGDLVADAVLETGKPDGVDVALIPADEILADRHFDSGSHTVEELVHALRYPDDNTDTIVILNLSGAQLLKAAERAVTRVPQPFDGFMQVAGLQMHVDPSKPVGQRISLASVNGAAVTAAKSYRVATTNSVANGSYGYFKVWDKSAVVRDTSLTLSKSLSAYLSAHPVLSPGTQSRILGL